MQLGLLVGGAWHATWCGVRLKGISAVRWLSSTFRFYSGRGALRCPCSNLALCFLGGL